MKVLFLDNFDSFTYNLVDELERRGAELRIYRNDVSMAALRGVREEWGPELLVISPGPSTPDEAGVCLEAVRELHAVMPVFGVCLGHQVIIQALGGAVGRAPEPVHGKATRIEHDGCGLFSSLPSPLAVGRYHSLAGVGIPDCLEVSARSADGIVMALRHRSLPVFGLQFHPESILTPEGGRIIERLLEMTGGAP